MIKGQVWGEKQCGRKWDTSENYNRKSTSVGNLGKVIPVLAPAPSYAKFTCICLGFWLVMTPKPANAAGVGLDMDFCRKDCPTGHQKY